MLLSEKQLASSEVMERYMQRSTLSVRWRRIGEKGKVAREGTERSKNRIPDQQEMRLGETRDVETERQGEP